MGSPQQGAAVQPCTVQPCSHHQQPAKKQEAARAAKQAGSAGARLETLPASGSSDQDCFALCWRAGLPRLPPMEGSASTDELLAEAIRLSLESSGAAVATEVPAAAPAATSAAAAGGAEQGGGAAAAEAGPVDRTDEEREEREELLAALVAMDFQPEAARQALLLSGGRTVDAVLDWLQRGEPADVGGNAAAAAVAPTAMAAATQGQGQPSTLTGEDELTQEEMMQLYGLEGAISTMRSAGEDALWRAKVVLDKVFGNIVRSPDDPKYRKLNSHNKKLARELFSVGGARALLLSCGFESWHELAADGSVLVLPATADLALLQVAQDALTDAVAVSVGYGAQQASSEVVYRCSACHTTIDGRRRHGPRAETWQGDKDGAFRYRCRVCGGGQQQQQQQQPYDLCEGCYDGRLEPPISHDPSHSFEVVAPERPAMAGAPMPPPPSQWRGR
jgi:hypothetical protein